MRKIVRSLADLKEVRAQLAQSAKRKAEEEARTAREREAAEHAAHEFRKAVTDVTPLRAKPRASTAAPRPAPLAAQRILDEKAALTESLFTEFTSASLLDTDAELSWSREGISAEIVRKLRRGHWTIQGELDLHGARRDEAREELAHFLRECIKRQLRCVRVVHGKGLGSVNQQPVLKDKVRQWLVQKEEVLAFCQAEATKAAQAH